MKLQNHFSEEESFVCDNSKMTIITCQVKTEVSGYEKEL